MNFSKKENKVCAPTCQGFEFGTYLEISYLTRKHLRNLLFLPTNIKWFRKIVRVAMKDNLKMVNCDDIMNFSYQYVDPDPVDA
jgi:hypothetical protein